eukprot:4402254-Amphidinium_carterae.1
MATDPLLLLEFGNKNFFTPHRWSTRIGTVDKACSAAGSQAAKTEAAVAAVTAGWHAWRCASDD